MIENKLNFFFKYQIWHIIGLIVLFYVSLQIINFKNGSNFFLGISSEDWFLFAMISPFLHQIYTWLSWRSELCWKTISNTIGFRTYSIIFYILLVIRMLFGIGLAFADYGTWFSPGWIEWTISLLFFVPFIYTMYSVKKYFGFDRATGIDHFDSNYKNIPFARIPVYDETIDNIVGIIRRRDLLQARADDNDSITVAELKGESIFVPDTANAADALQLFLKNHQQLGIVVDEFGSTAGVVAMEDIIEHILGREIYEESDIAVDMRVLARRKARKNNLNSPEGKSSPSGNPQSAAARHSAT